MKRENLMKSFGIALIISIASLTFWFSSKPGSTSIEQSNKALIKMKLVSQYDVEARTQRYTRLTFFIRKGAHFGIFMVLGVGIALVMEEDSNKIIILIILLAIFDEFHQIFTGRNASLSDVFLDMAGGFTGWAVVESLNHWLKKSRKR